MNADVSGSFVYVRSVGIPYMLRNLKLFLTILPCLILTMPWLNIHDVFAILECGLPMLDRQGILSPRIPADGVWASVETFRLHPGVHVLALTTIIRNLSIFLYHFLPFDFTLLL